MQGLIFRFKFLMLVTLFCAAMTVIFFIISQATPEPTAVRDIQLTTTITHVDGPTELYKMAGKEAQE
ncbi:hypothetical protein CRUP_000776 [Coryphaenoides rupestris]|nr:hypothetical protein CRUP_000776 [Coryphaenoides rupestris]